MDISNILIDINKISQDKSLLTKLKQKFEECIKKNQSLEYV